MADPKTPKVCDNHNVLHEKVDRLENHFKVYKGDMQDVKEVTRDIRNILTGTDLTNKKGVVFLLDALETRVENMEKRQLIYEELFNGFKWSSRAFVGAMISFIIWFLTKK